MHPNEQLPEFSDDDMDQLLDGLDQAPAPDSRESDGGPLKDINESDIDAALSAIDETRSVSGIERSPEWHRRRERLTENRASLERRHAQLEEKAEPEMEGRLKQALRSQLSAIEGWQSRLNMEFDSPSNDRVKTVLEGYKSALDTFESLLIQAAEKENPDSEKTMELDIKMPPADDIAA